MLMLPCDALLNLLLGEECGLLSLLFLLGQDGETIFRMLLLFGFTLGLGLLELFGAELLKFLPVDLTRAGVDDIDIVEAGQ